METQIHVSLSRWADYQEKLFHPLQEWGLISMWIAKKKHKILWVELGGVRKKVHDFFLGLWEMWMGASVYCLIPQHLWDEHTIKSNELSDSQTA